eukprot:scaffold27456_cov45-Phaeocystis_antarctica.AAC.1
MPCTHHAYTPLPPRPPAAVREVDGAARIAAAAAVEMLVAELVELRERDAAAVRDALPLLLRRVAAVPVDGGEGGEGGKMEGGQGGAVEGGKGGEGGGAESSTRARQVFQLRQMAEQEATPSSEDLFCLLISTRGLHDLRAINPYVSEEGARQLLDMAVTIIMHASRVGQTNRSLSEARGLLKLLHRAASGPEGASEAMLDETASALALKQQTLAEQLLARRQYVAERPAGGGGGDEDGDGGEDDGGGGAAAVAAIQAGGGDGGGLRLWYDPRFLLFEFVHNLVLREAQ